MSFVKKSAASELHELFPIQSGGRACAGDWQQLADGTRVQTGLYVYNPADERHVGRIDAYYPNGYAKVRWLETRWISVVKFKRLRVAPEETYR